jgi:hypothetical protein
MQSHKLSLKVVAVLSFVCVYGRFLAESASQCHLEIGSRGIERLNSANSSIVPIDGRKRVELVLC